MGRNVVMECYSCPQNEELKKKICPICITQKIVGGKWKLVILWLLRDGKKRFLELQRDLQHIKHSYLAHELKELEHDGLIVREAFNEMPPRVEYSLGKKGIDFLSVMDGMAAWGWTYLTDNLQNVQENQDGESVDGQ